MPSKNTILHSLLLLVCVSAAFGLAQEQLGPDSRIGHPTTEQLDWPAGIVELPRHTSRVYSMWCNGNEDFYFNATPQQVNELIALYAAAHLRNHELSINAGHANVTSFDQKQIDCNVRLNILSGIGRHFAHEKNPTGTHEPTLTLYAGSDAVWIDSLTIPDNLIIHSDIDGIPLKSKQAKPKRTEWHGRIQYEDFPKPEDFLREVRAVLMLWPENDETGFHVAAVGREGCFSLALSKQEHADLLAGKSRLTVTIGNHLTQPQKDDTLFPPAALGPKDTVTPVIVARPNLYYYGQILFEDGTPAVLDPAPWAGAEINVDFPFAGSASLDKQGCFKVFLNDNQLEALKQQKARKNIYIPSYTRKNTATAKYIFPVTALTQDPAAPGIIKIPRPEIPDKEKP